MAGVIQPWILDLAEPGVYETITEALTRYAQELEREAEQLHDDEELSGAAELAHDLVDQARLAFSS
jgi:hypothetical protein